MLTAFDNTIIWVHRNKPKKAYVAKDHGGNHSHLSRYCIIASVKSNQTKTSSDIILYFHNPPFSKQSAMHQRYSKKIPPKTESDNKRTTRTSRKNIQEFSKNSDQAFTVSPMSVFINMFVLKCIS